MVTNSKIAESLITSISEIKRILIDFDINNPRNKFVAVKRRTKQITDSTSELKLLLADGKKVKITVEIT